MRLAGSREQAEHLLSLEMAGHAGLSRERAAEELTRRLRGEAASTRGPRVRRRRIFPGR